MQDRRLHCRHLTKVFPRWMRSASKSDGAPLQIDIVDDYTFRISFAERYDGFPAYLSIVQWKGYTEFVKPAHYLKQWHADYTPLADLEDEIAEEGLSKGEWWTLFNNRDTRNWDLTRPKALGFPVLNPWMLVEQSPTTAVYDRNPYYFKVDSAGQQLPYINGLRSQVVADVEMSNLKVLAGEVDFLREDATLDKLDLYKENEDRAGYEVVLLDMHVTPTDARLNLTYDDPVWREVVNGRALPQGPQPCHQPRRDHRRHLLRLRIAVHLRAGVVRSRIGQPAARRDGYGPARRSGLPARAGWQDLRDSVRDRHARQRPGAGDPRWSPSIGRTWASRPR